MTSTQTPAPLLGVTPRRLQVFASVVESGGFGAASAALDISQPSVSEHIRALEKHLGVSLFDRQPGVAPQLTAAGRLIYSYAREIIERADAVSAQLGRTASTLRFAAQRFAATSLLSKPLQAFSTTHPRIELVARSGTFEEVHALFTSGAVDLAFLLTGGEGVPGIQTTSMGRYRLGFLAAKGHPLEHESHIPVATIARQPFVSAYRNSYFGRTIEGMLHSAGFPTPMQGSQAEEFSMVRNMLLAGMGISVSLVRSVQKELSDGSLVELDVDVDAMYLSLQYARNPRVQIPEIETLVDLIKRAEHQV